jgi:hypothetical protein
VEPLSSSLVSLAENAANLAIPEAIRKYMEKRRQRAFDILCEELRTAEIDTEEAALRDDMAAMLVKFFQATAQGAAFRNLKVLAKILAGKAADPSKGSDDFIMWADAIGGMLSEEVVFLATLIRHYEVQQQVAKPDEAPNLNEAMKNARNELRGKDKLFPDTPTYDGVGSALLRTGFVVPVSAWGGIAFAPSPRAIELARMVRLDEWASSNL